MKILISNIKHSVTTGFLFLNCPNKEVASREVHAKKHAECDVEIRRSSCIPRAAKPKCCVLPDRLKVTPRRALAFDGLNVLMKVDVERSMLPYVEHAYLALKVPIEDSRFKVCCFECSNFITSNQQYNNRTIQHALPIQ